MKTINLRNVSEVMKKLLIFTLLFHTNSSYKTVLRDYDKTEMVKEVRAAAGVYANGHNSTILSTTVVVTACGEEKVEEESTEFRSKQFNIITVRKKAAVLTILKLGYDVIFSDVDIAIIRDPISYLQMQDVDYVHSHNLICPRCDDWDFRKTPDEGNTGFYFVRSNPRTVRLWTYTLGNVSNYPEYDDQSIFWFVLRATADPPIHPLPKCGHFSQRKSYPNHLVTCPLDGCVFSAGALRGVAYTMLNDGLKRKSEHACSLHANYLKGNERKKSALQIHGYWLSSQAADGSWSGPCLPYKPKLPL